MLHPRDLPVHFAKLLLGEAELVLFLDKQPQHGIPSLATRAVLQLVTQVRDVSLRDECVHRVSPLDVPFPELYPHLAKSPAITEKLRTCLRHFLHVVQQVFRVFGDHL